MAAHRALIFGGAGALGRAVVDRFAGIGWNTTCVDLFPNAGAAHSIVLDKRQHWKKQAQAAREEIDKIIHPNIGPAEAARAPKHAFDAVISTAGGWAGGSIAEDSVFDTTDHMIDLNIKPAVIASHVASHYLRPSGLLVLTGAVAALGGTPSMAAYGLSKAAVHQLILSLKQDPRMPKHSIVLGIMPVTIDTPSNRASMPNADFSSWTPADEIAMRLADWARHKNVPSSGTLISFVTRQGQTSLELIKHTQ